jgi:competence protein ComEC
MIFWGKIPLLRLILPFGAGIALNAFLGFRNQYFVFVSALFFLFVVGLHLFKIQPYRLRWVNGVLVYFIFFSLGCEIAYWNNINNHQSYYKQFLSSENYKKDTLLIRIKEEPSATKKSWKAVSEVKAISSEGVWKEVKGKLLCYFENTEKIKTLNYGDELIIVSNIQKTQAPKNPNEFNYKQYLFYHQINFTSYINESSWQKTGKNSAYKIFEKAFWLRNSIIEALKNQGLDKNELAVASALMLGYKDLIEDDLQRAYSSAGAMHVLAVSGLHVGIVYGIFTFLLSFLGRFRFGNALKTLLLILLIWSYALLTGLSPSVLRAATMFSFVIIGQNLKRSTNFFNTLAASAFCLLLIDPYLLMEVGFQLSYLAVSGIVLMYNWFYHWFSFDNWLFDKVWQLTSVSLAAQIATFPLGLYYFHQFPLLFPVSNLVVIPAAALILILGIAFCTALPVPILSEFIAFLLKWIIKFTNDIVFTINNIKWSLLENIRVEMIDTWLLYGSIGCFLIFISTLKNKYLYFLFAGISLVICLQIIRYDKYNEQRVISFYNAGNQALLQLTDGRNAVIIGDSLITQDYYSLLFFTQNNRIKLGLREPLTLNFSDSLLAQNFFYNAPFIGLYNKKLLLIRNKKDLDYQFNTTFDYVILSNNVRVSISRLNKLVNFKTLVFDSSNTLKQIRYWTKGCEENQIKYLNIKQEGGINICF